MDAKTNLQQLAKALAQKKGLSQKDAETFLREFFDTIIQNVTTDKIVKVRGLGTFKLIEVLERGSVDITTGERIVIPGHSKLSFTPDTSLKDMVNKPFADFQTVVINEGTNIEDMERISASLPADDSPEEEEEEIEVPETEAEPVSEDVSELVSDIEPEVEPETEQYTEPNTEPDTEVVALQSQPQEEEFPQIPTEEPTDVRAKTSAKKWVLALGVVLLCVLSYFVGYYHVFDALTTVAQKKEIRKEEKREVPTAPAPKKQSATVNGEVEAPAKTPVVKEDTTPKTLDASKKYRITGTRKTHVMKPGDYLTRIAVLEYGDKDFTRYIIAHNRFPDPDNVPVGMEIELPELEEAGE